MRLERCVSIVNSRATNAMAADNVDALLKLHLDSKGISSTHIKVPPQSIDDVFVGNAKNPQDITIVTGGDGTVTAAVNSMMKHWAEGGAKPDMLKPIAIVPTGLQNSIATTLGLRNAEATLTAILSLRVRRLPLWRVSLTLGDNGEVYDRWMLGSLSAGTFENIVGTAQYFGEISREFTHWPMVRRKFNYASLNAVARHEVTPIRASVRVGSDDAELVPLGGEHGLRMVLASALPVQYGRYSLTPNIRMGRQQLSVCVATEEVTRSRMFHLLRREALRGEVLEEDGVALHGPDVRELELAPHEGRTANVRLDGELLTLPPGSKMNVRATDLKVPFVVA